MESKKIIQVQNVDYTFLESGIKVLEDFQVNAYENEFIGIVGPSGCGKTTLFKLITGLLKGYEGKIFIKGEDIQKRPPQVSYMQQKDTLMPWRTVRRNIQLPLELKGISKKDIQEKVDHWIGDFGLEGFEEFYPHQLSGGMRQRVGLLRAFLQESQLMLLDEPFGALDALTRIKMQKWLLDIWQEHKKTILFITHDIEEALYMADRVYVLSQRPATVIDVVSVDFPRPRDREMLLNPDFLTCKEKLMKLLGV